MQTPHGLYHIKNLFTTGIRNNNSVEAESSVSIKEKIKTCINEEDKENPISDQMIVTLLQKRIQISRRTVAKYREEQEYLDLQKEDDIKGVASGKCGFTTLRKLQY